jgi:hypothetical protein
VQGKGITPPAISVGATLATPDTKQATASAPQNVAVSNTGDAELKITSFSLSNTTDFELVSDPSVEIKVAKGASANIQVKFKPASVGDKTAVLTINSNDPAAPTKTVTITGKGTA